MPPENIIKAHVEYTFINWLAIPNTFYYLIKTNQA